DLTEATSTGFDVSAAAAATLVVSAPPGATAGEAFSTTLTAKDAFDNVASGYTGTISFSGGGNGPVFPSNYGFVGGYNGVHTFTNAVTLKQAGNRTITATDTAASSIAGSATVLVSPACAGDAGTTAEDAVLNHTLNCALVSDPGLSYSKVADASHGTVTVNANG